MSFFIEIDNHNAVLMINVLGINNVDFSENGIISFFTKTGKVNAVLL